MAQVRSASGSEAADLGSRFLTLGRILESLILALFSGVLCVYLVMAHDELLWLERHLSARHIVSSTNPGGVLWPRCTRGQQPVNRCERTPAHTRTHPHTRMVPRQHNEHFENWTTELQNGIGPRIRTGLCRTQVRQTRIAVQKLENHINI